MKKGFKRIIAMLCAVAMIIGGCFVTGGNTTKASNAVEENGDTSPVVKDYIGAEATVAPTENIPDGYVFAGWYTDQACTSVLSGKTEEKAYAKFVKKEVLSLKTQYATQDVQREWSLVSEEYNLTEDTTYSGKIYYVNKNISAQLNQYNDNYVLYMKVSLGTDAEVTAMKAATVELTNSGTCDVSEIYWKLTSESLKTGENEIYLSFADAQTSTKENYPAFDIKEVINYLRIFSVGDNVSGCSSVILKEAKIFGREAELMIADCDNTTGVTMSQGGPVHTAGLYTEGVGSYLKDGVGQIAVEFTLQTPINITPYKSDSLYVDYYVNDKSLITGGLRIELGHNANNTYKWGIDVANIQNGWNELCLSFEHVSQTVGTVNDEAINFFRVYQSGGDASAKYRMCVDNIRIDTSSPKLMIADCDNTTGVTMSQGDRITTAGLYTEGVGSYAKNGKGQIAVEFTLQTPINITPYKSDSLYVDYYVNDKSLIYDELLIELGHNNANKYKWSIDVANIQNGWNELCLSFENATQAGTLNDAAINFFRVYQSKGNSSSNYWMCVDNIRIEKKEMPINTCADIRFVTTVDSIYYANVGFEITIGEKTREMYSNKVYGTLYGVSGDETITYTPSVEFTSESLYFKAHTLTNIPETAFDTEIKVRPFWTTQDGTKVYGTMETYTINGEIAKDA